jgi:hypothetical protein
MVVFRWDLLWESLKSRSDFIKKTSIDYDWETEDFKDSDYLFNDFIMILRVQLSQ